MWIMPRTKLIEITSLVCEASTRADCCKVKSSVRRFLHAECINQQVIADFELVRPKSPACGHFHCGWHFKNRPNCTLPDAANSEDGYFLRILTIAIRDRFHGRTQGNYCAAKHDVGLCSCFVYWGN